MSSKTKRVEVANSMQSDKIVVLTAGVKDCGDSVTGVAVESEDGIIYLTVAEARDLAVALLLVAAQAEADNE